MKCDDRTAPRRNIRRRSHGKDPLRRLHALIYLSGAAGLIYQIVWSHQLREIFGVTVYAVTAVVATFLAGLALGSTILGRVVDRSTNGLRFYALLELGIGATALAGRFTIEWLDPWHIQAASSFGPQSPQLLAIRLLLAALVILPPTFLMGGTLPAIVRCCIQELDRLGHRLGSLYAVNTLGAVTGSLVAGFVLIRVWGIHTTLWIGIALNLIAAIGAWVLASNARFRSPSKAATSGAAATGTVATDGTAVWIVVLMAISGVGTLGLEVIWTRMLILSIGTTTYAFATVLSSFLFGIALGGIAARRLIARASDLRVAFGWLQLGIAVTSLATLPVLHWLVGHESLTGWGSRQGWLFALRFGVSLLVTVPPAVLMGMTFPVACSVWTRTLGRVAGRVGQVFGANTAGNILGAGLAGFVLIPALGLQRGLVAFAALHLGCAVWSLTLGALPTRPSRIGAGVSLLALLLVVGSLSLGFNPPAFRAWDEVDADQLLYYREGASNTVKVLQRGAENEQRWMAVDGIKIGQSHGGVDAKQQMLAHFPFLLRGDRLTQKLLSIGLGTGIVVGEVLRHGQVEEIVCVEISPSVIESARLFSSSNNGALDDPRAQILQDDGVNFLRRSETRYDAIISDAKSRTTHAANALFFSLDYYSLCREHLAADGSLIQWVPLSMPPRELRTILRTLGEAFPYTYVLLSAPHSALLVGQQQPLTLDRNSIAQQLADEATGNLRRYGIRDASVFAAMLVADGPSLAPWLAQETTINSLDHPVLEFYSPSEHSRSPRERRDDNLVGLLSGGGSPTSREVGPVLQALNQPTVVDLDAWLGTIRNVLSRSANDPGVREGILAAMRVQLRREADDRKLRIALGETLAAFGNHGAALNHFRDVLAFESENVRALTGLAVALRSLGQLDRALLRYEGIARIAPELPAGFEGQAFILAAHSDVARRDPRRAVALALHAVELTSSQHPASLDTLGVAYAAAGRFDLAIQAASMALERAGRAGAASRWSRDVRARLQLYRASSPFVASDR